MLTRIFIIFFLETGFAHIRKSSFMAYISMEIISINIVNVTTFATLSLFRSIIFIFGNVRKLMLKMCTVAIKYLKILNSIIISNAIDVVNNLMRFKVSSKMLFHNQTMFKYISLLIRKRMACYLYSNITSRFNSSTFPVPMFIFRDSFIFYSFIPCNLTQMRNTILHSTFFGRLHSNMGNSNFFLRFFRVLSSCKQFVSFLEWHIRSFVRFINKNIIIQHKLIN